MNTVYHSSYRFHLYIMYGLVIGVHFFPHFYSLPIKDMISQNFSLFNL